MYTCTSNAAQLAGSTPRYTECACCCRCMLRTSSPGSLKSSSDFFLYFMKTSLSLLGYTKCSAASNVDAQKLRVMLTSSCFFADSANTSSGARMANTSESKGLLYRPWKQVRIPFQVVTILSGRSKGPLWRDLCPAPGRWSLEENKSIKKEKSKI